MPTHVNRSTQYRTTDRRPQVSAHATGVQLLAAVALMLTATPVGAQTTKSVAMTVSGIVVDASGAPLAGTTVSYKNTPTRIRDAAGHTRTIGPVVNSTATTAADGSFSVGGLPPSVYWLCANGTQTSQIASCDWGFGATKADLFTAGSASNVKLQVHAGVTLTFQVSDARSQVKDFSTAVGALAAPGNFRIFVVNGTWLRPAVPVSATGAVRQYTITVPQTRSFRLPLDTKLNVLNQLGASVVPGQLDDTIVISGQPVSYSLTVP